MIGYESSNACIQYIRSTHMFEPCSAFGISRVNRLVVIIVEF